MHFQYEVALVLWCSLECTPPCQGGGRGFKSRQDRKTEVFTAVCGRVAQLAERPPEKRKVPGSMPGPTTIVYKICNIMTVTFLNKMIT